MGWGGIFWVVFLQTRHHQFHWQPLPYKKGMRWASTSLSSTPCSQVLVLVVAFSNSTFHYKVIEKSFLRFLRPELFFQWKCCFFGLSIFKIDFSMRLIVFWFQALWKTALCLVLFLNFASFKDPNCFSMKVFVFWSQAFWNGFLNENVLFGLRHCGRRCCALPSQKLT